MKRYSKYKPSDVEWISEIPKHWEIKKLKWICSLEYGNSLAIDDREDGDIPVFGSNGITGFHSSALTKQPCIIVGRKGSYGKINWSDKECFPIDTTYFVDSDRTTDHLRWLFYLLNNLELDSFSRDTGVPGLNREDAYIKPAPHPPKPEQTAIANFLDERTAKIDSLITNKQKLIELLKEERTAIINQAITRGIDPNVKLKPSGIELIGDIPENWDVKKFTFFAPIITCGLASTPEYVNEGVPFLSAQNVKNNKLVLDKYNFISVGLHKELTKNKRPMYGDILVTRVGAGIGDACIVNVDFEFSIYVSLTHIRVEKCQAFNKFVMYFFSTDYCKILNILGTVTGGGVGNLNVNNVKMYRIPLPSLKEQEEIVYYIENETKRIDATISKIEKEIELLGEYRTAVISEVVTGKIRVI